MHENIVKKKTSQKYFSEKKNFRQKKIDNKNCHKKKLIEKKKSKKILKIILEIFIHI